MPNPNARSICTAQRASGKFCESPSIAGAPFPICVHHAALVLEYLDGMIPRGADDRMIASMRMLEHQRAAEDERAARKKEPQGFVYYMQVGPYIKIGHTGNLRVRIRSYPPDAKLLAVEPGTLTLEAQRHRQFAAELRDRNEWFEPSPRLLAHIRERKTAWEATNTLPTRHKHWRATAS